MPDLRSPGYDHHRRHPEQRFDSLASWENEGGSLCQRPAADPADSGDETTGSLTPDYLLLDALPLGVLVTNQDGEITYSNPAIQKLYDVSAAELLGALWYRCTDARDIVSLSAPSVSGNSAGQPGIFEVRMVTASGAEIWTKHSIAVLALQQASGSHIHLIEDISARKAADKARIASQELLATERERARVTLESIGDAVISTDPTGRVTYLNGVAEQLTGWLRDEAIGQPLSRVFDMLDSETGQPIHDPAERAMDRLTVVQMPANGLLQRPDGSQLAIEDSAAPILDKVGRLTGAVVIFRDRRLSRENTARMAHLARHDDLTGLPNRFAFAEHFEQALKLARRHDKRVGVLFIDLDQFKQVNDSLGHKAGDRLLRSVARGMTACVRDTDLVCRHGGDEFVVLLSEIKAPEDAARVAEKLKAAVARPRRTQGCSIGLELSIGISLFPDDGIDMETLMHRADTAMYHAKLNPEKGPCFYHDGMSSRSPDGAGPAQRLGKAGKAAGQRQAVAKRSTS
jgi:diguanylate cyclase (GGDEF)-like protein/PAS domain S-box-containing protein